MVQLEVKRAATRPAAELRGCDKNKPNPYKMDFAETKNPG
jgi:hypothetical protein